jgi:hypothetical protein
MRPRTGYAYFVAQYCIEQVCSGNFIDEPPLGGVVRELGDVGLAVMGDPFSFVLTWSPPALGVAEVLVLSICFFQSGASKVSGSRWWFVYGLGASLESPFDFSGAFGDGSKVFQPGRAVGVRLSIYDADVRRLCRPSVARAVVG